MIQMRKILNNPDLDDSDDGNFRWTEFSDDSDNAILVRGGNAILVFRVIQNRVSPAGYPKMHGAYPMSSTQ